MLKVMMGGLMLVVIVAAATRVIPHGTGAPEMASPQQVYFRLHHDDELVAKP